jgi:uncharacterized OB-fold protein
MEMERIVKGYYDGLEEGRILGRKCTRCGNIEFPPVIACNACSCAKTEWIEIDDMGGYMCDFVLASSLSTPLELADLPAHCYATVKIADSFESEGSEINTLVIGVSKENEDEMRAALPVPVNAKIYQRDGYKTVFFEIGR